MHGNVEPKTLTSFKSFYIQASLVDDVYVLDVVFGDE